MLDNIDARRRGYALLLLRVVIGAVFFAHGYLKFFKMGIGGVAGFFASIGVPAPGFLAWVVAILETFGGLALIVGILTLPVGLLLAVEMAGAIYFAKMGHGFFAPKGPELEFTFLVVSLAVATAGPGAFSLAGMIRGRGDNRRSAGSS
jgi:putative oxidoreductase